MFEDRLNVKKFMKKIFRQKTEKKLTAGENFKSKTRRIEETKSRKSNGNGEKVCSRKMDDIEVNSSNP